MSSRSAVSRIGPAKFVTAIQPPYENNCRARLRSKPMLRPSGMVHQSATNRTRTPAPRAITVAAINWRRSGPATNATPRGTNCVSAMFRMPSVFMRPNCARPCNTPTITALTVARGKAAASHGTLDKASNRMASGILKPAVKTTCATPKRTTPPISPNSRFSAAAVQKTRSRAAGTLSANWATWKVVAREMPRSNTPKYPTNNHAIANTP